MFQSSSCESGANVGEITKLLQTTTQCQTTESIGCFHGACCVMMLDGTAASLSFSAEHRTALLSFLGCWIVLTVLGVFVGKIGKLSRFGVVVILICAAVMLNHSLCNCAATIAAHGVGGTTAGNEGTQLRRSTAAVCSEFADVPYSYSVVVSAAMGLAGIGNCLNIIGFFAPGMLFAALAQVAFIVAFRGAFSIVFDYKGITAAAYLVAQSQDDPSKLLRSTKLGMYVVVGAWMLSQWLKVNRKLGLLRMASLGWLLSRVIAVELAVEGFMLCLLDPTHFSLLAIAMVTLLWWSRGVMQRSEATGLFLSLANITWLQWSAGYCFAVFSIHALWLSMLTP